METFKSIRSLVRKTYTPPRGASLCLLRLKSVKGRPIGGYGHAPHYYSHSHATATPQPRHSLGYGHAVLSATQGMDHGGSCMHI